MAEGKDWDTFKRWDDPLWDYSKWEGVDKIDPCDKFCILKTNQALKK